MFRLESTSPGARAGSPARLAGRTLRKHVILEHMAIDLHGFQLILLRRPDNPPDYDDERAEQIQRDHLAFYAAMRQAGHVVTNGPVLDQPDEALRGMAIFATESADRARELANTDPAVRAGRLEVQAMTWLCPPGTMTRDGIPVTVPG
jgi:uncharacterized protein